VREPGNLKVSAAATSRPIPGHPERETGDTR
jgi:hypothetical protein